MQSPNDPKPLEAMIEEKMKKAGIQYRPEPIRQAMLDLVDEVVEEIVPDKEKILTELKKIVHPDSMTRDNRIFYNDFKYATPLNAMADVLQNQIQSTIKRLKGEP